MSLGGEDSGSLERGGGILMSSSISSSCEGASEAGMVASEEGSGAWKILGSSCTRRPCEGGHGAKFDSLEGWELARMLGPDEDGGRRESLSFMN